MSPKSATPRRYRSIAGLVRVLPARQLIPFWLAIGVTFAAFGFLIDVMGRGRSSRPHLLLNVALFAIVPAFIGSGLVFAGVTDTCMMGMLLARLPYNRPASCDVPAMVRALTTGAAPVLGRTASANGAAGASCGA